MTVGEIICKFTQLPGVTFQSPLYLHPEKSVRDQRLQAQFSISGHRLFPGGPWESFWSNQDSCSLNTKPCVLDWLLMALSPMSTAMKPVQEGTQLLSDRLRAIDFRVIPLVSSLCTPPSPVSGPVSSGQCSTLPAHIALSSQTPTSSGPAPGI